MKKNKKFTVRRMAGYLAVLAVVFAAAACRSKAPEVIVPFDEEVREGRLENGMTYFIRNNNWPENTVNFAIVQRVGSMQEEDGQKGLAHFLEHMAFNGSVNFPGRKTMVDYLEQNGLKFGENINAYTSFDETVYFFDNVPSQRESLIDSCLLILHDWSGFLTLSDEEIEQERPIIIEEWRTTNNASTRMVGQSLDLLFGGTRYAERMPIGDIEVIRNFKPEELREYYHKWYRPDLQAIVVVGNVDVDVIEQKIKAMFADVPKPADAAPRVYFEAPVRKQPTAGIITDPEMTSTTVELISYWPVKQRMGEQRHANLKNFKRSIETNIIIQAFSGRLADMTQVPETPFFGAEANLGNLSVSRTAKAWVLAATAKNHDAASAMETLVRENERLLRHGFTVEEIERAKMNMMAALDQDYSNRETRYNSEFVEKCQEFFLSVEGAYAPDIEFLYQTFRDMYNSITVESVNQTLRSLPIGENVVMAVYGPEDQQRNYPSQERLIDLFKQVKTEKIEAFEEEQVDTQLLTHEPEPGRILGEHYLEEFEAEVWKLSNGMEVYIKHTDFEHDAVYLSGTAKGGTRMFADDEENNDAILVAAATAGGVGNHSRYQIGKALAGKNVNTALAINIYDHGVSGASSREDIEDLFRMIYMQLVAPRKDPQAFELIRAQWLDEIERNKDNPQVMVNDSVQGYLYGWDNPRLIKNTVERVQAFDYDELFRLSRRPFEHPEQLRFVILGTTPKEELREYVKKYLASVPAGEGELPRLYDTKLHIRSGRHSQAIYQKMQSPLASVTNVYSGKLPFTLRNELALHMLVSVMDMVYTRTIREQEGGTYGVSTGAEINRHEGGAAQLTVAFNTSPEMAKELSRKADAELRRVAANGPDQQDVEKIRNYILKNYGQNTKTNAYWMGLLVNYAMYGDSTHTGFVELVNSITTEDIRRLASDLLRQNNLFEIIVFPM